MNKLPPGYLVLDENATYAVHMAVIQRFSADHKRFIKTLPLAMECYEAPDQLAYARNVRDSQGMDALLELRATIKENQQITLAVTQYLEDGTGFDDIPEPLFLEAA